MWFITPNVTIWNPQSRFSRISFLAFKIPPQSLPISYFSSFRLDFGSNCQSDSFLQSPRSPGGGGGGDDDEWGAGGDDAEEYGEPLAEEDQGHARFTRFWDYSVTNQRNLLWFRWKLDPEFLFNDFWDDSLIWFKFSSRGIYQIARSLVAHLMWETVAKTHEFKQNHVFFLELHCNFVSMVREKSSQRVLIYSMKTRNSTTSNVLLESVSNLTWSPRSLVRWIPTNGLEMKSWVRK